ncbi:hypothetical protein ABZ470_31855 [Streptosporangium sp. NPDC020072]|uniref:hypothetical protein n=1 Tax=Streptosporangium sp. NPDC020072 TaxID=3154788 RepID=UPI0034159F2C
MTAAVRTDRYPRPINRFSFGKEMIEDWYVDREKITIVLDPNNVQVEFNEEVWVRRDAVPDGYVKTSDVVEALRKRSKESEESAGRMAGIEAYHLAANQQDEAWLLEALANSIEEGRRLA